MVEVGTYFLDLRISFEFYMTSNQNRCIQFAMKRNSLKFSYQFKNLQLGDTESFSLALSKFYLL